MAHKPPPHLLTNLFQLPEQHLAVGGVSLEGGLGTEGLADAVRDHRTRVNAPGIAVVAASGLPEMPDQFELFPLPQVGAGTDTQRVHLLGRDLPDAEKALDGELRDESVDPVGRDDEQSVGLPVVRGDLRQHLVHRNTC